jgi:hypothetical protein
MAGIYVPPSAGGPITLVKGNQTGQLVSTGFTTAQAYATSAVADARSYLSQMQAAANALTLAPINASIEPDTKPDPYAPPALPAMPFGTSAHMPGAPAEPALAAIGALSVGNAPEFTAVPLPLNLPTAPGALVASVPAAPNRRSICRTCRPWSA